MLARCAAVCLLILTALPFTAPFATCELADSALVTVVDDSSADSKSARCASLASLPAKIFVMAPVLLLEIHSRIAEDSCIREGSPALATPLRL
jgi:hypothetical protein